MNCDLFCHLQKRRRRRRRRGGAEGYLKRSMDRLLTKYLQPEQPEQPEESKIFQKRSTIITSNIIDSDWAIHHLGILINLMGIRFD